MLFNWLVRYLIDEVFGEVPMRWLPQSEIMRRYQLKARENGCPHLGWISCATFLPENMIN